MPSSSSLMWSSDCIYYTTLSDEVKIFKGAKFQMNCSVDVDVWGWECMGVGGGWGVRGGCEVVARICVCV